MQNKKEPVTVNTYNMTKGGDSMSKKDRINQLVYQHASRGERIHKDSINEVYADPVALGIMIIEQFVQPSVRPLNFQQLEMKTNCTFVLTYQDHSFELSKSNNGWYKMVHRDHRFHVKKEKPFRTMNSMFLWLERTTLEISSGIRNDNSRLWYELTQQSLPIYGFKKVN